ncbi:MAG: hypothetical protein PHD47_02330 [Acholeplasmataceae bacterium]|nr:hypothetical protein [Acholeplasmataceae bacterium]
MNNGEYKIQKPQDILSIGVMIAVLVYTVFVLLDVLLYYFGDTAIKQTFMMGGLLSTILLSFVVIFTASKGKTLLGTTFFLLTLIIERGLSFIRTLIDGTISLSTFAGFYHFVVFVIFVYSVIVIVTILRREIPKFNFLHLRNFLLPLIAIGYYLLFVSFSGTLAFVLPIVLLVWFEEERFIPWFVTARFLFSVTNILDYFIIKNTIPGYTQSFATWLQTILALGILVLAIISIFNPNLLIISRSNKIEQVNTSDED